MIKFLDLKKINKKYQEELKIAANRVIDSGWYILGNELKSFPFYFNKKIKNVNFEIKELEKIALLNRLKGWIPKYRNELRIKYKNDYLNANYTYILLTYLRSILRLIV